jgi:ABC-2 type transport system ATP-binding protein
MKSVIVNNISRSYGKEKTPALKDVSFEVSEGELFGLIGADGAGKTSIFRILTTLLLPDNGSASVNGYNIVKDYKQIRNTVGYMPGKFSLYQDLTIEENLRFFATIFNTTVEENYHLIEDIYVQIEKFKKRRAGNLSGGMKQKLALCCALIHKPAVLFLDEPTTGVDPVSRKEFWEMLKQLKEQKITIIVSTPYMDEAKLCDRIALIEAGKVLSIDTPENIVNSYPDSLYAVKGNDSMYELLRNLSEHPSITSCYSFGEYAHVSFINSDITEEEIKRFLEGKKMKEVEVFKIPATIEDSFIKLLSKNQL